MRCRGGVTRVTDACLRTADTSVGLIYLASVYTTALPVD